MTPRPRDESVPPKRPKKNAKPAAEPGEARTVVVIEKNLLSDQSGATMVLGVFMAMIIVGMIYYVWGLGGTILHRERLQDATDTAMFSAAVIHARGMNIIVLLNVIMQVLAILGTAMRVIQDCLTAAAVAAGLTALGCGPWCAFCCEAIPYIPIYTAEALEASSDAGDVEDYVDPMINGINQAQRAVARVTPWVAQGLVATDWPGRYAPTTGGIGTSLFYADGLIHGLQMEDDDSDWACHNKVALWAGISGAAGAAVTGSQSVWLYAGIATATVPSAYFRSERYCSGDDGRNFQRVPEDSHLGEEEFQIRGGVWSVTPPHQWVTNGVATAQWGSQAGSNPSILGLDISFAQHLHQLGVAQSEYYYETRSSDTDHEEWAWHPYWRARMRRFYIRPGGAAGGVFNSVLNGVQSVIVH